MDNANATSYGEELPEHLVEDIHRSNQAGYSHQTICSLLGLKLEDVKQVLAKAPSQDSKFTESSREKSKRNRLMTSSAMAPDNSLEQSSLEAHPAMQFEQVMFNAKKRAKISEICMESNTYNTQDIQAQLHENTLPTFFYSYRFNTDQLHRTSLVTGQQSKHRVPSSRFKYCCCWSEVPGGSLLITGGGHPTEVRKVVRIDTRREFAVSHCPPMLTSRGEHAAVYHSQHLYVLGGWSGNRTSSECERYVCAENRWEALPPLPRACHDTSGVVVESSLYALGGYDGTNLDLVQKLSLESLTWELMQLRLPQAGRLISCFKLSSTEVFLVVNKTLCSFTSLQIHPLRTLRTRRNLAEDFYCWYGASYYRCGTLYCSSQ
jgi:hypothetical protein